MADHTADGDELPELYDLLRSCARKLDAAQDAIKCAGTGPVKDLAWHLNCAADAIRLAREDIAGVLEP